jgi:hypothetical protein
MAHDRRKARKIPMNIHHRSAAAKISGIIGDG